MGPKCAVDPLRRWSIPFRVCLLALGLLVFGFSGVVLAQMDHTSMSGGRMDMDMGMYRAVPLSGCDDYHCRNCDQCKSRDFCSTGGQCDNPECGHKHATVECHGCSIFYLRARGASSSCMERATQTVAVMNSAMQLEDPWAWRYVVRDGRLGPAIWLEKAGTRQEKMVVTVTQSDVIGYQYRATVIPMSYGAGAITDGLVAHWWAALLQDHFDAMVLGVEPSLTVATHCGKPLLKAYEAARLQAPDGPIPMTVWKDVFARELTPTDRDRLGLVAQIIPMAFKP